MLAPHKNHGVVCEVCRGNNKPITGKHNSTHMDRCVCCSKALDVFIQGQRIWNTAISQYTQRTQFDDSFNYCIVLISLAARFQRQHCYIWYSGYVGDELHDI